MENKILLTQAFSLTMLQNVCSNVKVHVISEDDARQMVAFKGLSVAIKDHELASYLSDRLECNVPAKKQTVRINKGEMLVVQYVYKDRDLNKDNPINYFYVEVR